MSKFSNYNLKEEIQKALLDLGYETPTPIQDLAIPKAMDGLDLIASAQTGSGKTAAFMLPILNLIASQPSKQGGGGPQALILVPTRELAMQVSAEAGKFSKYLPYIKTVCIYGGVPYPIQRRSLNGRYDILVATPGRLIDHMERGRINLSKIKLMVLDEADRMLDMGFIDAVEQIAAAVPKTRQTLLFSATIDGKIRPVSKKLQKEAFEIRAEPQKAQELNIEQQLYFTDNLGHKNRLLEYILANTEMKQTIIFTATKQHADELSNQLYEKGYSARSLHGDMTQRQRTQTINRMRKGEIDLLVATDVAARGLDIPTISHVINFDLPRNPEDFIHRVGRTGRAGASGVAISFAAIKEERWVAKIKQLIGKPLTVLTIPGLEPQSRRARPQNQDRRKPFGNGIGRERANSSKRRWSNNGPGARRP